MQELTELKIRIFNCNNDKFKYVKNSNVLLYTPNGVGDWVFWSYLIPLLEPSNKYFMTRIGDGTVSIMEGSKSVTPLYLGFKESHQNGIGNHKVIFGVNYAEINGDERTLMVPNSLYHQCQQNKIDLIYTGFPDSFGSISAPFQSKIRRMIPLLVKPENINYTQLNSPLESVINFGTPHWVTEHILSALQNKLGFNASSKLCMISRNGYSITAKNWGHLWRGETFPTTEGDEARDFMRHLRLIDNNWMFITMEDKKYTGKHTLRSEELKCLSYSDIFGDLHESIVDFGTGCKAIVNLSDLSVGVPTGPFHLSMVKKDLPTVGIWLTLHHPGWFDEPKDKSIHIVGRAVVEERAFSQPGSNFSGTNLRYKIKQSSTRCVNSIDVIKAVEELGLITPNSHMTTPLVKPAKPTVEFETMGNMGDWLCTISVAHTYARLTGEKVCVSQITDVVEAYNDGLIVDDIADRKQMLEAYPLHRDREHKCVNFLGAFARLAMPNIELPIDFEFPVYPEEEVRCIIQPFSKTLNNPPLDYIQKIVDKFIEYTGEKLYCVGNDDTQQTLRNVDYSLTKNSVPKMMGHIQNAKFVLTPRSGASLIAAGYKIPTFIWEPIDGESWHLDFPDWINRRVDIPNGVDFAVNSLSEFLDEVWN